MRSPGMEARGSYYGGLKNMTVTDPFDVPQYMDGFDAVAQAADREMLAVLASDLTEHITEQSVSDFVNVSVAA